LVEEGRVGDVLLLRATWLSDEFLDPDIPFDWRFERRMGGSTIADLGAHLIDLALWIVGEIGQVCAQSETFTRERSGRAVDVNQAADHLERWPEGPWDPDLAQGARVQAVCEAMERSAAERRWVDVAEVAV